MIHIAVISGSVRLGRQSHFIAEYLHRLVSSSKNQVSAELLDLKKYSFPLFEERLKYLQNPALGVLDFAQRISKADGIILVSPEYNGSFAASVKNAIDLLKEEWVGKPIGIVTVASGSVGGIKSQVALQQTFLHLRAIPTQPMVVPDMENEITPDGQFLQPENLARRSEAFISDLLWMVGKMKHGQF